MTKTTDLIKNDLCDEFKPKFQGLKKGLGIAPAGGGSMPPKPKMPPTALPTQKKPSSQTPQKKAPTIPKAPTLPKAPGAEKPKVAGKQIGPSFNKEEKDSKDKEKRSQSRYHIHKDGAKITDSSQSLSEIYKQHGKDIESKGFRLVEDKYKKNEEIAAEVMGGHKPRFLGDIKELAKNEPQVAMASLPYASLQKAGTQHVLAGVHIPNEVAPPPKSKKVKGNKDEGSGGQITHKEEIPANKVIKPKDGLKKDVISMQTGKKMNTTKKRVAAQPAKPNIHQEGDELQAQHNKQFISQRKPQNATFDKDKSRKDFANQVAGTQGGQSSGSGVQSKEQMAATRKQKNADIVRKLRMKKTAMEKGVMMGNPADSGDGAVD